MKGATDASRLVICLGWIVLAILPVGCEDPSVGVISGLVTVDGAQPKTGAIAFFPTDGMSFTAGSEITDGHYTARVPLGELRVEIRIPKQVGEQKLYDVPDSPMMPLLDEALPARYNNRSELRITVQPGRSEHNFEVTTD